MISVASLIYRSTTYADFIVDQVRRFTPLGKDLEFFLVANDATEEVLAHLKAKNYPHYIHTNTPRSDEWLFAHGIGWPNYLHGVYRAWNFSIRCARGKWFAMLGSDIALSPNWLENMLKALDGHSVVAGQLVERPGPKGVFPGAIVKDFGSDPATFQQDAWLEYVPTVSKPGTCPGGSYGPLLYEKRHAEAVGYYPEGNLCGRTFREITYGDKCFVAKLAKMGVKHVTATDALAYHFREGEMNE